MVRGTERQKNERRTRVLKPQRLYEHTRIISAIMCLCYGLLCLVLPFNHNHISASCQTYSTTANRLNERTATGDGAVLSRVLHAPASDHCISCEWQATNVSAAQPSYMFVPATPAFASIPETTEDCFDLLVLHASSRGPPVGA